MPADVQGDLGELKTLLKRGQSSIIYLHGLPGVGKDAFSRTLLRTLQKSNLESVPVVYFSFSDQDVRRISSTALMSSMICQILSQDPQRFGKVRELYLTIKERSIWSFEALWNLFCSLRAARDSGPIFCIVNQIHSCDSSRTRFLNRLLNPLVDHRRSRCMSTPLRVILIGELRQDIQDSLETCPQIQLNIEPPLQRRMEAGVNHLTAALMVENSLVWDFEEDFKEKLYKCEDFGQLSMTLDILTERKHALFSTKEDIRSALQALPYDVLGQVTIGTQKELAMCGNILRWMLHAQRPMAINELATAYALFNDENTLRLEKDGLPIALSFHLRDFFHPLIKEENNEVYWSHEQVKTCSTEFSQMSHNSMIEIGQRIRFTISQIVWTTGALHVLCSCIYALEILSTR